MTEQLSGMDAAFLALESPELPLHVVGVLLLDPSAGDGWSIDRFCQVVRERLPRMPPFNRRLVEVPSRSIGRTGTTTRRTSTIT